jgi:hypothetical protein
MSAMGQPRTTGTLRERSALGPQPDISLQTKLQTNGAARHTTSHNQMGWSQLKCRTRAHG